MNSAPAAAIPGGRIGNYRNSSPRLIRLLGLGDVGGKVVRMGEEDAAQPDDRGIIIAGPQQRTDRLMRP